MRAAMVMATILAAVTPAGAETFKCPKIGGTLTFGQEANVNSLDQMTSSTISTRNIAMNIFEALMTRDENNNPILDLADSMTESPDRMTYSFTLRPRVTFHNGKPLTATDVAASFDRYSKLGLDRQQLDAVEVVRPALLQVVGYPEHVISVGRDGEPEVAVRPAAVVVAD